MGCILVGTGCVSEGGRLILCNFDLYCLLDALYFALGGGHLPNFFDLFLFFWALSLSCIIRRQTIGALFLKAQTPKKDNSIVVQCSAMKCSSPSGWAPGGEGDAGCGAGAVAGGADDLVRRSHRGLRAWSCRPASLSGLECWGGSDSLGDASSSQFMHICVHSTYFVHTYACTNMHLNMHSACAYS